MKRYVHFTQYLRPDGRQADRWVERPEAIADKAERITQAGFRLECEVLLTGDISLTIGDDEGDYAGELCANGPGIEEAVDRLISTFPL